MSPSNATHARDVDGQGLTVYCLVPPHPPHLQSVLRQHFRDHPNVEVVVESRQGERRNGRDRRESNGASSFKLDRRRGGNGNRIKERRSILVPVEEPPALPGQVADYADSLTFVERVEEDAVEAIRDAISERESLRGEMDDVRDRLARAEAEGAQWRERCAEADRRSLETVRALVGAVETLRKQRTLSPSTFLAVHRAERAIERYRAARIAASR